MFGHSGHHTHLAPNSAENIAELAAGTSKTPQYISGQYEGDMILTQGQWMVINGIDTKTGLINEWYRWQNREIPYEIHGWFDDGQRALIRDALNHIQDVTCLSFVERSWQDDYIIYQSEDSGCWSYVGRVGGGQSVNLQLSSCVGFGTIVHETIHALGFHHMQSATERDQYIQIHWENIREGAEHNFNRLEDDEISNFGIEYDIKSVMHYGAYQASGNGQPTITTWDGSTDIGTDGSTGMTWLDQQRVNAMYC